MRASQILQRFIGCAARRGQLTGPQQRPRRQRVPLVSLGYFGQLHLPRKIFRLELCHALQTKQRIFFAPGQRKELCGLAVLLARLLGPVLFLLQKRITRDALRRLVR